MNNIDGNKIIPSWPEETLKNRLGNAAGVLMMYEVISDREFHEFVNRIESKYGKLEVVN